MRVNPGQQRREGHGHGSPATTEADFDSAGLSLPRQTEQRKPAMPPLIQHGQHRPGNFRDAKKRPCLGTVFCIDSLGPGSGGFSQPARSTNSEQAYTQQQRGTRLRYIDR